MIRGTTPTHIFFLPFEAALVSDLRVSYEQNDRLVLVKKKKDAELSGNTISVTLTQDETLLFDCSKRVIKVELKVKTVDGVVASSGPMIMKVEECINEEVL